MRRRAVITRSSWPLLRTSSPQMKCETASRWATPPNASSDSRCVSCHILSSFAPTVTLFVGLSRRRSERSLRSTGASGAPGTRYIAASIESSPTPSRFLNFGLQPVRANDRPASRNGSTPSAFAAASKSGAIDATDPSSSTEHRCAYAAWNFSGSITSGGFGSAGHVPTFRS
jgi:hypothetical protein